MATLKHTNLSHINTRNTKRDVELFLINSKGKEGILLLTESAVFQPPKTKNG